MSMPGHFSDAHFSPRCGLAAQRRAASMQQWCVDASQQWLSPGAVRGLWTLSCPNTRFAGKVLFAAIAAGLLVSQAFAQSAPPQGEPQTAQAGLAAPAGDVAPMALVPMIDPPDEVSSRAAFAYVRAALAHAVKAVAAGDDPSMQAADLPPPDGVFPGACVTIREVGGRLLARGVYVGTTRSVEYATQRAMEQAVSALPQTRDILQRRAASEQLARAIITLEVSGQPTPLRPSTFAELDSDLDMGLDGVLAIAPTRDGEQSHAVFPLAMLVGSTPPSRAVMSAVSVASGDPALAIAGVKLHEAEAVRAKGVRIFRLRVRQLAQLAPQPDMTRGVEPVQLVRGSRLIRTSDLSTDALRDVLVRLTDHTLRRATTDAALGQDLALWDELRPLEGLQQGFAQPASKALATFALLHVAQTFDASEQDMQARNESSRVDVLQTTATKARALAERLLVQQFAEEDIFAKREAAPKGPVESAAWLVALMAGESDSVIGPSIRGQPWFGPLVQELVAGAMLGLQSEGARVTGFADNVPKSARALFAQALVAVHRSPAALQACGVQPDALLGSARAALTEAYLGAGPGDLVSQLPWLWWAQELIAEPGDALPPALLELREHLWENQLRETDNPDLLGGIILREQLQASGKPMPTWQGLRPITFAAAALRDDRMTPQPQRMSELAKLLGSLRFTRQLVTDESCGWAGGVEDQTLANSAETLPASSVGTPWSTQPPIPPPTMLWGVKAAPWDHRLPLDASVAGLLALSESLRSLEAFSRPAGQSSANTLDASQK